MWQKTLKSCIDAHLQGKPQLRMVISPDIDGCVSAVLLAEYARKRFSIPSAIMGVYDLSNVMVNGSSTTLDDAFNMLWVDLDVHFPTHPRDVVHVGQHLLRTKVNKASFNPNDFFGITEITEKYPFSTAFFLFYGLFDEVEFPLFVERHSMAQSCLFHCDATFMLVHRYGSNCRNWAKRLFPSTIPYSVERLLSGSYAEEDFAIHSSMFGELQQALSKKEQGGYYIGSWQALNTRQTVEGNSPNETFSNVHQVVGSIKGFFGVEPSILCATKGRIVWQGKRVTVPVEKLNLQDAASHAWTYRHKASVTYET